MARIRTIKPEFPQSESIGRLSRDARLLFIQLWTIVDDGGRARAHSRMLASLLYPYDDDAPGLIETWMDELEREGCIRRYIVDGTHYLDIPKWLEHQKIDHPRGSRLPAFSGDFAKPREDSRSLAPDLGPRTVDLESSVVSAHAAVSAAVGVIQLFDEERVDAFGEERRRPWANPKDSVFADRWLAAGADFELCRAVFKAGFGAARQRGRAPPDTLSYFDKPIADAIEERKRPMAEGNANGRPTNLQRLGPATGIAEGFAEAARRIIADENGGGDQPANVPLLGGQRRSAASGGTG